MDGLTSVGALVTNECGDVLLVKSPLRGWEFPGGMLEAGETPLDALHREILEETGAQVKLVGMTGIWRNAEKGSMHGDFRCRYVRGKLTTSPESTEVRWVRADDALRMVEHPLVRKRLESMLQWDGVVRIFGYQKDPFGIVEEREWKGEI